jgi:hypothetical protein
VKRYLQLLHMLSKKATRVENSDDRLMLQADEFLAWRWDEWRVELGDELYPLSARGFPFAGVC